MELEELTSGDVITFTWKRWGIDMDDTGLVLNLECKDGVIHVMCEDKPRRFRLGSVQNLKKVGETKSIREFLLEKTNANR